MPDPSTTNPVSETVKESAEAAAEPQDDAISLDAEVDALISRVQKAAADVERRASGEDADLEAAGFPSPEPAPQPDPAPLTEPEPEQESEPEATTESAAETPDSATFADVEEAIAEAEAVAAEELGNLTDDAPEATAPDSPAVAEAPAEEEAALGESVDAAIAAAETAGEVEALEAALAEPEPEPDTAEPASETSGQEVSEPVEADMVEPANASEAASGIEAADFDSVDAILEASADTDDVAEPPLAEPTEVEADAGFEPAEEALAPPEAAEEAVEVAAEAGEGADALGEEDDHHFESFEEATSDSEAATEATPPVGEVDVEIEAEVDESAEAPDEVEPSEQAALAARETSETTEDVVAPVAVADAVEPVADPAVKVTAAPIEVEPESIAPAWRRVLRKTAALTITAAAKIGPLARVIRERAPQYWAVVQPRLHAVLHLLNAPYRRLSPQMREFVGWAAVVTAFAACSVWIIIALRG